MYRGSIDRGGRTLVTHSSIKEHHRTGRGVGGCLVGTIFLLKVKRSGRALEGLIFILFLWLRFQYVQQMTILLAILGISLPIATTTGIATRYYLKPYGKEGVTPSPLQASQ